MAAFFTSYSTVSIFFFFLFSTESMVRRRLEFGNAIDMERLKSCHLVRSERVHKRCIEKTAGAIQGRKRHSENHGRGQCRGYQALRESPKPVCGSLASFDTSPHCGHEIGARFRIR